MGLLTNDMMNIHSQLTTLLKQQAKQFWLQEAKDEEAVKNYITTVKQDACVNLKENLDYCCWGKGSFNEVKISQTNFNKLLEEVVVEMGYAISHTWGYSNYPDINDETLNIYIEEEYESLIEIVNDLGNKELNRHKRMVRKLLLSMYGE